MLQIEALNRASLFQIPREEDKKFRMSPESVSLWLLKSEMNYLRPSAGALDTTATIHSKAARRFIHPRTKRELRGNGNARDSSPRVVKIARTVSRFRGR